MESHQCLNCGTNIDGNFCSNCGQKTDTHRITAKHFFMHDLLHGVWHIEKGILFTLKQALLRPGFAALEYIQGKRIKYYNVFYLILLLIGFTILVGSTYDKLSAHYFGTIILPKEDLSGRQYDQFITDYSRLIIYAFVPLFALNSFILFRRKKFNFSEHLIIAGMIFLGVMTITLIGEILYLTDFLKYADFISRKIDIVIPVTITVYVLANYYRTFKNEYKVAAILFKLLLFSVMIALEVVFFGLALIGYFSNFTFNLK